MTQDDEAADTTPSPPPKSWAASLLHPVRRLRALFRALLAAHASPSRLALAALVGAVVGATPFFGLHLWICLGLAWLVRLNPTATYAAANISLPPLIPLLGYASVQIGERLLHHRWLSLSRDGFHALLDGPGGVKAVAARFFVDWMLGGLFVGVAIGLVMAGVVYAAAKRRADRRAANADENPPKEDANENPSITDEESADDSIAATLRVAARRYLGSPRKLRWYAWFKYRMDPCYRRLAELIPEGAFVVDVGTGLGMLPLLLALLPGGRRAFGLDWDGEKLAAGKRAIAGLDGAELATGDARTSELPACDVVTLVDVLHYHAPDEQRALLSRAAAALRPGGMLLVREGDARRRGGARWTRALESLAVRLGWNRGAGQTKFRPAGSLATELESLGLRVTVEPLAGKLHPGNVLLRAERALPVEDGLAQQNEAGET